MNDQDFWKMLFRDDKGHPSWLRVAGTPTLLVGLFMCGYGTIKGFSDSVVYGALLVSAILGIKGLQKKSENHP
jgi:hypothetical protein